MNQEEMLDYKLKGYCCSQIVTDWCLKKLGKENQDMVEASAGLCIGLGQERNCGILSAAICMLYLIDPEEASQSWARDLFDWFEGTYGTIECSQIIDGDPLATTEKCPAMIAEMLDEIADMVGWD